MRHYNVTVKANGNDEVIELFVHHDDCSGEAYEVYAYWNGEEIAVGGDVDECLLSVSNHFNDVINFADSFFEEIK